MSKRIRRNRITSYINSLNKNSKSMNNSMNNMQPNVSNGYVQTVPVSFQISPILNMNTNSVLIVQDGNVQTFPISYIYSQMIVENVVEKVVEKEVIKCVSPQELEECPICNENKAIISFSCCSIHYCSSCAMQIFKDKNTCSQCRKPIDLTKVKQLIE